MKGQNLEYLKVAVRIRPRTSKQKEAEQPSCLETIGNTVCIFHGQEAKEFEFDYVFGDQISQKDIYENACSAVIRSAVEGYSGTIISFGQNRAGKTFTILGSYQQPENMGIIPRGIHQVIKDIELSEEKINIYCSFIQIYCEQILDLIDSNSKTAKRLRQHKTRGMYIENLVETQVSSISQMLKLLQEGTKNQCIWNTKMGTVSSRSTNIFTIRLESQQTIGKQHLVKISKLHFVDLASSSKIAKTGVNGNVLEQTKTIGKSLSALGVVIATLTSPQTKIIPYRESTLTRYLQDSLGGHSRTLLLINVSPTLNSYDETLSSLRFGYRARGVKNNLQIKYVHKQQSNPGETISKEQSQEQKPQLVGCSIQLQKKEE